MIFNNIFQAFLFLFCLLLLSPSLYFWGQRHVCVLQKKKYISKRDMHVLLSICTVFLYQKERKGITAMYKNTKLRHSCSNVENVIECLFGVMLFMLRFYYAVTNFSLTAGTFCFVSLLFCYVCCFFRAYRKKTNYLGMKLWEYSNA